MNAQSPSRQTALVYGALFTAVVLAYFFGDRQLAAELKPYLHGVQLFPWLTHVVDPLGPLASIGVAAVAARALGTRRAYACRVSRSCASAAPS